MAIETTERGPRHYFDTDAPEVRYPGVTTIIGMEPKPFLPRWAAGMTAELAVDFHDVLARLVVRDRKGAIQWLTGASDRYKTERGDIGTDAHIIFENMIRGEDVGHVHPDMVPYRDHFQQFLDAVNPELVHAEDIAWSDTHKYAGSFDAILRVWVTKDAKGNTVMTPDRTGDPMDVIVDWKTSKSAYASVALQLSAYSKADIMANAEGDKQPFPKVDTGAVLHITADSWVFKPVEIGDEVFSHFLSLRHTLDWDRTVSRKVFGKAWAKKPRGFVTGTERRAK
jgi:hypothetical protein